MEIFKNAPVTEALIDIKAELPANITSSELEKIHDILKTDYPTKKARRRFEGAWQIKEDAPISSTSKDLGVDGFQFWSTDDKQVIQCRLDGFTFSRLKPYQGWESMFPQAIKYWNLFVEQMKPLAITRIAVRYINSIDIPEFKFDLEEYFVSPLKIPSNLPQTIEHFLSRITVAIPDHRAKAIITQAILPVASPSTTPILFDIDIFKEVRLTSYDAVIKEICSELHSIADDIFDKSLTNKTKELFR